MAVPSSGTLQIQNTEKRDTLIESEKRYQKAWAEAKLFEQDAPSPEPISPAELRTKIPRTMNTMAYPYVNGTPHAGHAFTASKLEFATGWGRMKGKKALYPQGFHCTGMPIKACADKLVREIEMFGQNFGGYHDHIGEETQSNGAPPAPTQEVTKEDVTKFTAKKSKANAKVNKALKYQFQIMQAIGIPTEEIYKFADAQYWLQYFPALWKRDLDSMGCRIDWRRSFVTTPANPYYDAFVQWQMTRLYGDKKIRFGKRYTVYSPKDGQACMDHDRQTGEGVGVQEYLALKLTVQEWADAAKAKLADKLPEGAKVHFVPATLRPETMYGQTCCFVSPGINYGIYEADKDKKEYFFLTDRAARNMAFQSVYNAGWGEFTKVAEISGSEVIGTKVSAPLSVYKDVYILPMESIKANKGTGVVTCVPSDSPDDYATTMDLLKKPDHYKIKREWIDKNILPIISTPSFEGNIAEHLVKKLKINSPKDVKQLAEAKEIAYKEGFYQGTMVYGDFKGQSVQDAKPLVRQQLVDAGEAFNYAEPDGLVISRSGDECVAGHLDQWFLNYGEPQKSGDPNWQPAVLDHLQNDLNTFNTETKNAFEGVLNWLAQWACARSYGLGTKLPWDQSQLVESLSDSTIYMAYYTFAHLLHKDIFGKERGQFGIAPEELTDEVWDYLFTRRAEIPEGTSISKEALQTMRHEFEYWYPLDCRISGKDLIQNHLTFFLYVHVAIFPKEYWPRAIRVNGHLMLNGEKMSKSTGNFLTLRDAVDKFGADATRLAFADAGDGIEDANFEESVANANILRMYELRSWCESIVKDARLLKDGETYNAVRQGERHKSNDVVQRSGSERNLWDRLFENELNGLVKETGEQYELTNYKAAMKSGLYDFISARDFYREATKAAGVGMHHELVKKYIELQALMITVVAPHWAEFIWLDVLGKPETVQNALFPEAVPLLPELTAARDYVKSTSSSITQAEGTQIKRMSKGKSTSYDPKKEKKLTITCATKYPSWQEEIIQLVQKNFANMKLDVAAVNKGVGASETIPKSEKKKAMPFVMSLKQSLESGDTLEKKFDEVAVIKEMAPMLRQTVQKCVNVEIVVDDEGGAVPGKPSFFFANV
ncbi:leucyl-tRNA synthetase [Polychaeton citri CBS 116435]|uniref:leucine--tRNA ligase n=1 Tax=Polychaeton citri CBS 116435 TaxID=1314669 RepID=A0A9P4Q755_9PEZI|nr:leucyl-tRNA synthetase [Polychaeton citri CBS 116435]